MFQAETNLKCFFLLDASNNRPKNYNNKRSARRDAKTKRCIMKERILCNNAHLNFIE